MSTTRLWSNCTMVSRPQTFIRFTSWEMFLLQSYCYYYCPEFQKVSSVMLSDSPLNRLWLNLPVCVFCSIPDWGEVVPDPGLPQGRRSLHQTLQRGTRESFHMFLILPFFNSVGSCCFVTHRFLTFQTSNLSAYLFVSLPPGDVHRGGCEVLPGRAGAGTGPPPQPGHHLPRPQTWEVRANKLAELNKSADMNHAV